MASDHEINYLDPGTQSHIVRADGKHNCPNCGHCITGEKCEYCGTIFVDFACISMDEPFFMKIKHKSEIRIFKVFLNSMGVRTDMGDTTLYADNRPIITLSNPTTTIDMEFQVCYEK